jgi:hypothetical protein
MAYFARAMTHFVFAGALSGVVGLAFSALVFYVLVLGLLYSEQPVHGSAQETIELPEVADYMLTLPIAAIDLEPPPDRQPGWLDTDYLGECLGLLRIALAQENLAWTLTLWAVVAAGFAIAVGILGATLRAVSGIYFGPIIGVAALATALGVIGVLIAHFQYQVEMPYDLNSQGRLVLYAVAAGMNLLWISIVGFRLRALLFTLAAVVTGEILVLGIPPETCTTTALWHSCLFLFVPAGYGWLVVERAQMKEIID